MPYIIYDPNTGKYGKKLYKRIRYPLEEAGLFNTSRWANGPYKGTRYDDGKLCQEVHEVDAALNVICVHPAPPSYIYL